MESVAVQPKAFVLRWAEVPAGARVVWQMCPLRKSIAFGVCRCVSKPVLSNSSSGSLGPHTLPQRLEASGLHLLNGIERVHAGDMREGELTADGDALDGLYAFVFDNTFSKSTSKTVSFYFSVEEGPSLEHFKSSIEHDEHPERADNTTDSAAADRADRQVSAVSSGASTLPDSRSLRGSSNDSSAISAGAVATTTAATASTSSATATAATASRLRARASLLDFRNSQLNRSAPQLVRTRSATFSTDAYYRRENSAAPSDRLLGTFSNGKTPSVNNALNLKTANTTLSGSPIATSNIDNDDDSAMPCWTADGRYLSGILQKKRRKRHQGFARRYFVLDLKLGLLSYFLSRRSSSLRGVMPMRICNMAVNERTRDIVLDSSVERWLMRAPNVQAFAAWLTAFQGARASTVGEILSRQVTYPAANVEPGSTQNKIILRTPNTTVEGRSPVGTATASAGLGPAWSSAVSSISKLKDALDKFKLETDHQSTCGSLLANAIEDVLSDFDALLESHRTDVGSVPELVITGENADENDEFFDALETLDFEAEQHQQQDYESRQRLPRNNGDLTSRLSVISEGDPDAFEDTDNSWSDDAFSDLSAEDSDHETVFQQTYDQASSSTPNISPASLSPLPCDPVKRRIEVPKCKSPPPSILSIIRKNAGKDLTSITMPIATNEPVTALQKLAEMFEYSEILDRAVRSENAVDRCMLVAVFAVSQLSSMRSKERASRKPFNPLLGETFELVREDKGFRFLAEKVSHRPPIYATCTESENWAAQFTSRPHQKMWAKSAEVTDTGVFRLLFKETGETFEFMTPDCFLRNILAGEKYLEPSGSVNVESSLGPSVRVTFHSGGMFSGRSETLSIQPNRGNRAEKYPLIEGKWTEGLSCEGQLIWEPGALISSPKERYGWTQFTASLNEITPIEENKLPPTDSRLREDQRLYEQHVDDKRAEEIKLAYEEAQRRRRKEYEEQKKVPEPQFFNSRGDAQGIYLPLRGKQNYWSRREANDWTEINNIFAL